MKMSSNFEWTDALVDDQELWMYVGKCERNVVPAHAMKAYEGRYISTNSLPWH
jgi:hypothetical protein